jgi:hypothetical protein
VRTQLPPLSATGTRRRRPVLPLATAAALAVVAVGLGVLLVRGGGGAPPTPPAPGRPAGAAPAPTATTSAAGQGFSADGATRAYVAIQRRRDQAYANADDAILRAIYTPSCPCLTQDLGDLALERRNGYRFAGPATRVRNVRVRSLDAAARTALVVAEVNYGAARYTDSGGNLRFVEKDQGWQTAQTLLGWDGRRWRVQAVVALR